MWHSSTRWAFRTRLGCHSAEVRAGNAWFVGDPDLPGHEMRGLLHLQRWGQWVSHFHRGGVYDGEHGKLSEYARSLPPRLLEQLRPHLDAGGHAAVLAEEWQTVDAVLQLDWLLERAGLRDRVAVLWNANNTFGFESIDWARLLRAAVITTVADRRPTAARCSPRSRPRDSRASTGSGGSRAFADSSTR